MQFYFKAQQKLKEMYVKIKSNSHMDGDDDNDNKQLLDDVEHDIMNYQK